MELRRGLGRAFARWGGERDLATRKRVCRRGGEDFTKKGEAPPSAARGKEKGRPKERPTFWRARGTEAEAGQWSERKREMIGENLTADKGGRCRAPIRPRRRKGRGVLLLGREKKLLKKELFSGKKRKSESEKGSGRKMEWANYQEGQACVAPKETGLSVGKKGIRLSCRENCNSLKTKIGRSVDEMRGEGQGLPKKLEKKSLNCWKGGESPRA